MPGELLLLRPCRDPATPEAEAVSLTISAVGKIESLRSCVSAIGLLIRRTTHLDWLLELRQSGFLGEAIPVPGRSSVCVDQAEGRG